MLFNTDKIEHNRYFHTYVKLAGKLGPKARVLELGVQAGGSLLMWQALFPLGEVTGVDNNETSTWPEGTIRIVSNQDDPELLNRLPGKYDLIVDDASHDGGLTQNSFNLLWPLVADNGYYVVEDWVVAFRGWGRGMLDTAETFLALLNDPSESNCDEITYREGMIILHRSANDKSAGDGADAGSPGSV